MLTSISDRNTLSMDNTFESANGNKMRICGIAESESQAWLTVQFPELFPSLPAAEDRLVNLAIPNPFLEGSANRHAFLRPSKTLPEDGAVDGYVKFRIRFTREDTRSHPRAQRTVFSLSSLAVHHRNRYPIGEQNVPSLPPDFGRSLN